MMKQDNITVSMALGWLRDKVPFEATDLTIKGISNVIVSYSLPIRFDMRKITHKFHTSVHSRGDGRFVRVVVEDYLE